MKKGHKQCKDCLAYYDVHHTCDGLMKVIVQAHKKNEECQRCGLMSSTCERVHNEWTRNCMKVEGQKHIFTPQSEKNTQQPICEVNKPLSSNGTWEERFEKEFKCKCFKCMENKNEFCTTFEYMKSYIKNLLLSERTSMIGEVEKIRKEVNMEAEVYSPLNTDPACIHGWNACLDQVINYLKNK